MVLSLAPAWRLWDGANSALQTTVVWWISDMFGNLAITNSMVFCYNRRITDNMGKVFAPQTPWLKYIIQAICRTLIWHCFVFLPWPRIIFLFIATAMKHSNAAFCDSPQTPKSCVFPDLVMKDIQCSRGKALPVAWLTALSKETYTLLGNEHIPYQLQTVENMRPPFLSRFWKNELEPMLSKSNCSWIQ